MLDDVGGGKGRKIQSEEAAYNTCKDNLNAQTDKGIDWHLDRKIDGWKLMVTINEKREREGGGERMCTSSATIRNNECIRTDVWLACLLASLNVVQSLANI